MTETEVRLETEKDDLSEAQEYQRKIKKLEGKLALAEKSLAEKDQEIETLRETNVTDGLTGLRDRRGFDEEMDHAIALSGRLDYPFSVLLLDTDDFKSINDTFGHPVGDDVLREIGKAISDLVRSTDTVARNGGDEFGVILPGTPAKKSVIVAEKIRETIETTVFEKVPALAQSGRKITVSIGCTGYPGLSKTTGGLIREADTALYHSKTDANGKPTKNRVTLYNESMPLKEGALITKPDNTENRVA